MQPERKSSGRNACSRTTTEYQPAETTGREMYAQTEGASFKGKTERYVEYTREKETGSNSVGSDTLGRGGGCLKKKHAGKDAPLRGSEGGGVYRGEVRETR